MNIQISDKKKKDVFISLFQLLKNCSSHLNLSFDIDLLHIQGMDKSHVCLFNVKIKKEWFANYKVSHLTQICLDSSVFYSILSTKSDNQDFFILLDENNKDTLVVNFLSKTDTSKSEFTKKFKIPLIDYDYEEMLIPNVDYEAEFSLSSKHTHEIFSQLSNFGNDIIFNCNENDVLLKTDGVTGEMIVEISIDDLNSYSIVEEQEIKLTYSLIYIYKMCITNKLSSDINFSLSDNYPMKINYPLGDDSFLDFYIAPKMDD